MKNTKIAVAVLSFLLAVSTLAYAQQDTKAAKARKELANAKKELREAKLDSAADFQRFNAEAQLQIAENEKKIAELRARKNADNMATRKKYEKNVTALEVKNNELKKKMKTAGATKTDKWASFKREFAHDMSEFGRAFRDLGTNNSN